jgi:endogenous inhibitor of DNA gyrase (YacG/DUF329 family)
MAVETFPCPQCGQPVETSDHDFPKAERAPAATEGKPCPHCGTTLVRDLLPGRPWRFAK